MDYKQSHLKHAITLIHAVGTYKWRIYAH